MTDGSARIVVFPSFSRGLPGCKSGVATSLGGRGRHGIAAANRAPVTNLLSRQAFRIRVAASAKRAF